MLIIHPHRHIPTTVPATATVPTTATATATAGPLLPEQCSSGLQVKAKLHNYELEYIN